MNSDKIENFKLAVPLAWFRQTGYLGYNIPNVMVSRDSPGVTVTQTPDFPLAELDNNIKENSDNAVPDQTQLKNSVPDIAVADENSVKKKNGQLPPPPDFGIPNNPEGKNGVQPKATKSTQKSTESFEKPANTNEQVEGEPPVKSTEPTPSTEPIFR